VSGSCTEDPTREHDMALPHEGYADRVDPHSTTGTVMGFAYETAKWATWRNPWFISRIGTSGWDSEGRGVMSWLERKTGLVNAILSPESKHGYKMATKASKLDAAFQARAMGPGSPQKTRMRYGAARTKIQDTLGFDSVKDMDHALRTRRRVSGPGVLLGDRGKTPLEQHVERGVRGKIKAGTAGKGAKVAFGVGRLLRGANVAMWGYEIGKAGLSGFHAVAGVGAHARTQPYATVGSGVEDSYMSATLRQSSLMDMYSSEYGNRRHMGNEARFLHM